MSTSNISDKIKIQLWTLSGGRCEYRGCNKALWREDLTMSKMNKSYIAHIVADKENGPRGDKKRSSLLANDYGNLMLLCDEHHRLIDIENIEGHSEELLLEMKKEHEKRIELLTSLNPENKTHIVLYGANIGKQATSLTFNKVVTAILPFKYPTNEYGIELNLSNSLFEDDEGYYWKIEEENLERQFKNKIEPLKRNDIVEDFSLFPLAPQPLLIKLGTLFTDIYNVEVFQLHREPQTWDWQKEHEPVNFQLKEPEDFNGIPVLKLSLSANITDDRINSNFNSKISIWTITHKSPNNDFLKSKGTLSNFRKICRKFFDEAKAIHGQNSELHIFPAMPVSAAVELGRIWMPKADMSMIIYDQNKTGFQKAIYIS